MPQPILKIQIQADWNFLVFLPSTLYMMNSCMMPYIAISPGYEWLYVCPALLGKA